jgi:hypothetical protein
VIWKEEVDYLRCSSEFNHRARYGDCVILQTDDGPVFAQLRLAFTIISNDTIIPIVLVQAFDNYGNVKFCKKDRDLGLVWLQQRPVEKVEFFFCKVNYSWCSYIPGI